MGTGTLLRVRIERQGEWEGWEGSEILEPFLGLWVGGRAWVGRL